MSNYLKGDDIKDTGKDLHSLIGLTCDQTIRQIDNDLLSANSPSRDVPQHNDLGDLMTNTEAKFETLRKLLAYYKDANNDDEMSSATNIGSVYDRRSYYAYTIENKFLKSVLNAKQPSLNPAKASYILNTGNFDLLNLSIKEQSDFDNSEIALYEYMDRVVQRKLCSAILPDEDLTYEIKEGILKVTTSTFSFEVTVYYDQNYDEFNWFLYDFEHKLIKTSNYDKKIEAINAEISNIYETGQRGKEVYIIPYLIYKMKHLYSRKKLKPLVKQVEILKQQFEVTGTEEIFDVSQMLVSKETILVKIHYWRNSLLHSLNPNHPPNCLTISLNDISLAAFPEQYDKNSADPIFSVSQNEAACIFHDPFLPTLESLVQLEDFIRQAGESASNIDCFKKAQEIVAFQTSKRVRLVGFNLDSNFYEIFNQIRKMFQTYQLLTYFCLLSRKVKKNAIQNVYLSIRESVTSSKLGGSTIPNKMFINLEVDQKVLLISVDPTNGKVDFNLDLLNCKDIEVHKSKFKTVLRQNPQRIMLIILLFKKLLLIGAFSEFLLQNGAKFYPERDLQIKDNFNSITYVSHGVHSVGLDMLNDMIKIIFSHKLEFDEMLENLSITTNIQFRHLNPRPNEQAAFVLKSSISLADFDIKRISQEFGELLMTKRCLAYYNLEISKMESYAGSNVSISLNDTQKFLPKVGVTLSQTLSTQDNTIFIKIRPSSHIINTYNNYVKANEGLKLVFFPQRPKVYELYENEKLTIKYGTVVDAYQQIQKDVERLEEHIRSLHLDGVSDEMEEESGSQHLHGYSYHALSSSFSVRFSGDKLIDILPLRYTYWKPYHNHYLTDDKDRGFQKKLFIKEIKQALPILEFSTDLNDKKVDLRPSQIRQRELENDGEMDAETQAKREKERESYNNIVKWISKYHTNVISLDPWHHVISWRSFFDPNLANFFLNLQLLPDGDFECYDIYYDFLDSVERERLPENHMLYTQFKKVFSKYSPQPQPTMNGAPHHHDNMNYNHNTAPTNPNNLRIRLSTRADFVRFISQLTMFFVTISSRLRNRTNSLMAPSLNSAGSTGNMTNT